jgi:hypothetical protein
VVTRMTPPSNCVARNGLSSPGKTIFKRTRFDETGLKSPRSDWLAALGRRSLRIGQPRLARHTLSTYPSVCAPFIGLIVDSYASSTPCMRTDQWSFSYGTTSTP